MYGRDWSFLLDQLRERASGDIADALVVSADGLRMAASTGLPDDRGDQLAAVTSGLVSLTNGAADLMSAGPVEQTVCEMRQGYLIVMAIGDGSILTVLASKSCDLGKVIYEMSETINAVGAAFTPAPRGYPYE